MDREKQITEIWLNYLEESKTNPSLTPEDYAKRYPEYVKDLAALLAFTRIGQEVIKTDLTPLVNRMKDSVWTKVQANLAENRIVLLIQKYESLKADKKYKSAFETLNQIELLPSLPHVGILLLADSYYLTGFDFTRIGDFALAEQSFQKSLTFYQKLNGQVGMVGNYSMLGKLAFDRNDLEGARKYYHNALDLCKKQNLIIESVLSYQMLGSIALRKGSLDSAKTYFTEAERVVKSLDNKELYVINQTALAEIEDMLGYRESAINRRKQIAVMEKKGIKIKNKNLWITNYLDLASLYAIDGKKSLARKMASEASRLLGKMPAETKEAKIKIEITAPSLELIKEITGKGINQEIPILDRFRRESLFPAQPAEKEIKK